MLNPHIEKTNAERLLSREEVPVTGTINSPFESNNDILLSGSITSVAKGQYTFHKGGTGFTAQQNQGVLFALRDNQIENALKDLRKLPDNPYLLNNAGLVYLASGNYDKAIELFKRALEKKDSFIVASLNLALTYRQDQKEAQALDIYKDLLRVYPEDYRILINVADIYTQNKNLVGARSILEDILKRDGNNIGVLNRLGIIDLSECKYTKAISKFRMCIQLNPRLSIAYNNLGVAYGLAHSYKKAVCSFKAALTLSPNYVSAIENLATTLSLYNNISEAIDLLDNYLRQYDNNRIRESLAKLYAMNAEPRKALRFLNMALSSAVKGGLPQDEVARLHNNIGVVYTIMGHLADAEKHYLHSIQKTLSPNRIALTNIIDLYFAERNFERAREYIDFLGESLGRTGVYLYYLAVYEYHSAKISEAIDSITTFLHTAKTFPSAYSFLSFVLSEHLYDFRKAIEINREALTYLPGNPLIINNLAYNYLMDNDLANARELLAQISNNSDNVFLTATRGLLMLKEGNLEDANRLYDLAATLARGGTLRMSVLQKKHLELAKYFLENNRQNDGKDNLDKALSIKGGETIYAKQALELLERYFRVEDVN